jgi:hypothetical protein
MSRAYRKAPQVTAHSEEQAERWLADGRKAAGLMAKLSSEMQAFISGAWKTEI